jgi:hypothetical protein
MPTTKPLEAAPGVEPSWSSLDEDDTWTRVAGGTLEAPIYIRIAKTKDGRGVINGLLIGGAWPREQITANTLRSIKIGEILEKVFDGWDINTPPDYDDLEDQVSWGLMHETFVRQAETIPSDSRAGSRSAPSDQLEEFARAYLTQRGRNAYRAMTATAKEFSISRATANRWAARCRDRGLLPPLDKRD